MTNTFTSLLARAAVALGTLCVAAQGRAQESPESVASREIARVAIIDLRQQERPTPDDMLIAAELLTIASSFDPSNADLIRRRIEALQAAGDDTAVIAATRELVAADPTDTVAQLRLLSWTVGLRQTVRERLQAYARLVSDDAADIVPASVRSRLALDAAILARESGRDELFDRMIRHAIDLDPSNKEAVALAVAVRMPGARSALERFNLLTQLLMADPLDPNIHFSMASELIDAGAFRGAQRFYSLGLGLLQASGDQITTETRDNLTSIRWHAQGPRPILEELNARLLLEREIAQRRVEQLEELGEPTDDLRDPSEVRLPPTADQFRVVAALALDRRADAINAVRDIAATSNAQVEAVREQLAESELTPEEREEEQLTFSTQTLARVATLQLVVGDDIPTARANISGLRRSQRVPEGILLSLDALLMLRTGQPGAAIDLLEGLAARAALTSLTIGLAYEELGLRDQAIENYRRAVDLDPLDPFALLARSKHEQLTGERMVFSEERDVLEEVALRGVPAFIDNMVSNPSTFMTLRTELVENNINGLDPSLVRISIRNTSPIQLSIGSDRPISSRFLFSPLIEIGATRSRGAIAPEVIELSHRLSLQPREEFVAVVDPTIGNLGYLLDLRSSRRVRARWRVLQGFEIGPDRAYIQGGLSLSGETPTLVRAPVALARSDGETIGRALAAAEGPQLAEALRVLRTVMTDPDRAGGTPEGNVRAAMIQVVVQRFSLLDTALKYIAAIAMPPVNRAPPAQVFDDAAWAEPDPRLRTLMIATRVTDPDDPQLELAKGSDDARLAAFAARMEARLERTSNGFAKVNQGTQTETTPSP